MIIWEISIFDKIDPILQFENQFWVHTRSIVSSKIGGPLAINTQFLRLFDNKPEIFFDQETLNVSN